MSYEYRNVQHAVFIRRESKLETDVRPSSSLDPGRMMHDICCQHQLASKRIIKLPALSVYKIILRVLH
jgi:hypothetical protein